MENHKGTNQLDILFIVWGAMKSNSVGTREGIGGWHRAEDPVVTGVEGQAKEFRCFSRA